MSSDTLYDQGNRYVRYSTAGTFVVRDTPVRLKGLKIANTSAAGLVTLHNGASALGDVVASIGATGVAFTKKYEYDVVLSGGLTVVVTDTPEVIVFYE